MSPFRARWLPALALLAAVCAAPAEEAKYDLVIRGGRVVDGTGNPWFVGDVAVRGDRIAAVGRVPAGAAAREIDARGLVVAPGFIDMHSHSDFLLLEDGSAPSKVRQGVTTEVLGEGNSAGPYPGALKPERGYTTLGGYLRAVEQKGVAVNVASYVGLDNVWQGVMGTSFARPTPEQFEKMKALLDAAMADGAFGLSSMLMMPPGSLATTDDLVELCKMVARHRGLFSSHVRNEGTGVFDSVREAIAVGERAGVPVDVIHLKIADQKFWGRMDEVVALFEAARKRGVNVQANVYPYTRGNNNLSSIIPPWAHEGGTAKMLERLQDPAQWTKMKADIKNGLPGWYNHYTAVGGDWSRMLVSGKGTTRGSRWTASSRAGAGGRPRPRTRSTSCSTSWSPRAGRCRRCTSTTPSATWCSPCGSRGARSVRTARPTPWRGRCGAATRTRGTSAPSRASSACTSGRRPSCGSKTRSER